MSTRLTPGRRLLRALRAAAKAADVEFTDVEVALTLPLIETAADRIAELKRHLADQLAKDETTLRCVQIAAEVRQAEAALAKLVDSLGIDDCADEAAPIKSTRHQEAGRKSGAVRREQRIDAQRTAAQLAAIVEGGAA